MNFLGGVHVHRESVFIKVGVRQTGVGGGTNQSEGAKHRQALNIGQAEFHQTHGDDEAVKDVPTNLRTHRATDEEDEQE